jgi:hypothetical protein
MGECVKCKKVDVDVWTSDQLNKSKWADEEKQWFGEGPVCEECGHTYFQGK